MAELKECFLCIHRSHCEGERNAKECPYFLNADEHRKWDVIPGRTVWFFFKDENGVRHVFPGIAHRVQYCVCMKPVVEIRYNPKSLDSVMRTFGLDCFATEEDAIKAYKERAEKKK